MSITEFIEARLDETERIAREATPGPWKANALDGDLIGATGMVATVTMWRDADADHIALNDPAHVLAWVAAIRAVVEIASGECMACAIEVQPCELPEVLRAIVAIWHEHPDFDSEWA